VSPPEPGRNPPLGVTLNLKHEHPHLLDDRKLSLETLQHFGVGYCSRGILRGMVAFPIHDDNGVLVAYAGRRLRTSDIEQFGKYKFPTGFRKEIELFNLHRAKGTASENGLILVEGFFSVLKLYEAGFRNTVASMGCHVSDQQVELLVSYAKEVVILFDADEAGQKGAASVADRLRGRVAVRLIELVDMDLDELLPATIRWLVNGVQGLNLGGVSIEAHPKRP
jgi:DNA primase